MTISTERIEHLFLKENYLLGLYFPGDGLVSFRVLQRESIPYMYDEIGTLTADEWKEHARLGIAAEDIDNALWVGKKNHIYQVFYGIKPSAIKIYLGYPLETPRRNLDVKNVASKEEYGYIDGRKSPYDDPSPETEIFIPYGIDVGFAWHNPLTYAEKVLLFIHVNRYYVNVIRDVDLIEKILARRIECRIATLGGLERFEYPIRDTWNVDAVPLDAARADIEAAVRRK